MDPDRRARASCRAPDRVLDAHDAALHLVEQESEFLRVPRMYTGPAQRDRARVARQVGDDRVVDLLLTDPVARDGLFAGLTVGVLREGEEIR